MWTDNRLGGRLAARELPSGLCLLEQPPREGADSERGRRAHWAACCRQIFDAVHERQAAISRASRSLSDAPSLLPRVLVDAAFSHNRLNNTATTTITTPTVT